MLPKKLKQLSGMQLIALGFLLLILGGTFLLMLPCSSRTGEFTPFITALFTATSATCVTGLILVDTYTHWSFFGQLVLLLLIQIGGLGFITIGTAVSLVLRRKIGLKERGWIKESFNVLDIGGVVRLIKRVLKGTVLFEGIGALLLFTRFYPKMGFLNYITASFIPYLRFAMRVSTSWENTNPIPLLPLIMTIPSSALRCRH